MNERSSLLPARYTVRVLPGVALAGILKRKTYEHQHDQYNASMKSEEKKMSKRHEHRMRSRNRDGYLNIKTMST